MEKKSDKTHKNNIGSKDNVNQRERIRSNVRLEEQRFQSFVEHSSDIIVVLNLEGIITYINPAVERVLGFKPEERIGAEGFELVHPDDIKLLADSFITLSTDTNHPIIKGEMHLRHKDGSWRTLEAVGSNLAHKNVVEAIIVNYRDITERKQVEDALKESENKYRLLANNVNDVIFVFDMNLNYTYVSPSVKILRGYETEEVLKQSYTDILTPSSVDLAMKTLSDVMEQEKIKHAESTESRTLQLEMRRKDGTTVWTEVKFTFIRDENQQPVGILGVTRDITERKQAENELRESEHRYQELSIIDDLTQLYNSRHFYTQLEREIERSNRYVQPLTFLLLDLDHFKMFNDTYGHVEGDNVLSRLGQVLKRCLRETDSAYRYGGEEFTIMLPMTTSEEGIVTAKRIQTELRKEVFSPVMGQEVFMTVSIGLAQYKPKEEMKAFVKRVDQLMYLAKKNGRDRICSES
ncbi:MAG: sensor domain-containing diguanylate cyclase [Smithella sp.]